MKKTVSSLAILKVNWDCLKKDYNANFIPFIATLIVKNKYTTIDINNICKDFKKEFGLIIPYHPMHTVLERARKLGIIKREYHEFIPITSQAEKYDFTITEKEQMKNQGVVINSFIEFAKKYELNLDMNTAEAIFVDYLKKHDFEILFAAQQHTILPDVKTASKSERFIIHKFIRHLYEVDQAKFKFVLDVAVGHILACTLLYSELNQQYIGKLKKINFYLDTRLLLSLLGIYGKDRKESYIEFIKVFLSQGSKLFIFSHTHEEIMDILDDCLNWIEDPRCSIDKASDALKYFMKNNYRVSDVERFIVNLDKTLEVNNITKIETASAMEQIDFQIDESKLYEIIVESYRHNNEYFNEELKKETIQRDIKSISSVYKFRKGKKPRRIQESGHIFLTTNSGLAYANRKFEISQDIAFFPVTLTDVFVGTLIWLQTPAKVTSINERKIIADCYSALQPDNRLLKKYCNEIEKLSNENKITEEEYYLLRTHRACIGLLEEKTLGDPDRFIDKLPEEILEEIKLKVKIETKIEEEKKYLDEKEKHLIASEKLNITINEKEKIEASLRQVEENINNLSEKITNLLTNPFYNLLVLLIIIAFVILNLDNINRYIKIVALVIATSLTILNIINGLNLKGIRDKLKKWLKNRIIKLLKQER